MIRSWRKNKNNFLASIHAGKTELGISFLDISTGEFYAAQGQENYIYKLIQGFAPAELIYSKSQREKFEPQFGEEYATFVLDDWVYAFDYTREKLVGQFKTTTLKGYGIDGLNEAISAAGAILHYLEATEHNDTHHIASISRIDEDQYVWLDKFTIRNLEIIYSQHEGGVPLLEVLDQTVTPMGSRQLRKWMILPLKEKSAIDERLNSVEQFFLHVELAEEISGHLRHVADLERLISKVAVGRINPREMLQLKRSLQAAIPVKELLTRVSSPELNKLGDHLSGANFYWKRSNGNSRKMRLCWSTRVGSFNRG